MRIKNKLLLTMLSVIVILVMLPIAAFALDSSQFVYYSNGTDSDGNTTITIRGVNLTESTSEINFPSSIDGKKVTRLSIERSSNQYYSSVTKVTLPYSVRTLNTYDLEGFSNLNTIVLGYRTNDVNFDRICSQYSSVKIVAPENSRYYSSDDNAIYNVDGTKIYYVFSKNTFEVPSTVSDISMLASRKYDDLTVTVNSENPYLIESSGVIYNSDKTEILLCNTSKSGSYKMPSTVTSIAKDAFAGCKNLTSVTFSNNVTKLVYEEFIDCTGLTSVKLPTSLTKIGTRVFENTGISSISFGGSLATIGDHAFYGCKNLTSVKIPNSVTSVGDYTFANTGISSVTIGSGLKKIGNGMFANTKIASINIPSTVTTIGNSAFYNCSNIKSLDIPSTVKSIGSYAFAYTSLSSVSFGSNITTLSSGLFAGTKFTSFTVPSNIKTIGGGCFSGCTKLKTVNITKASTIGSGAFSGCTALTSVKLPDTVESIESYTFSACSSLKSIDLPSSLQYIGERVFTGSGITSLKISNTVTKIAYRGCMGATNLKTIDLPSTAVRIGGHAFDDTAWYDAQSSKGAIYLENVLYGTKSDDIGSKLTVKSGTKVIADYAFSDHNEIKTLVLPDGLEIIGDYAFSGCKKITKVHIPASVYEIGHAFYNCGDIEFEVDSSSKYFKVDKNGNLVAKATFESTRTVIREATCSTEGLAARKNTNSEKSNYVSPISIQKVAHKFDSSTKLCKVCGAVDPSYKGLLKVDGVVSYYSKGKVVTSYSGLYKMPSGSKYHAEEYVYLSKGKFRNDYRGLVKKTASDGSYTLWYVKNGVLSKISNLVKMPDDSIYKSGKYVYLSKGKFMSEYTGLVKKTASDGSYTLWYVKNGILSTVTGNYKMPDSSNYRAGKTVKLSKGKYIAIVK